MDIKLLRYFQAVCREKSFTSAARILYLSVPGLVKAIDRLEEEIGTKLFIRGRSGIVLTPAGISLNRHADSLLRQCEYVASEVRKADKSRQKSIDIRMTTGLLSFFPADFLSGFVIREPEVRITARSCALEHCLETLMTSHESVCLYFGQIDTSMLEVHFHRESPLYLVMSKDHPCAGRGELMLSDLSSENIIINNTDPGMTNELTSRLSTAGCSPRMILDGAEWAQSLSLVRDAGYMTFCIPSRRAIEGMVVKQVADLGVNVNFNLATVRGMNLTAIEQRFIEYVVERMQVTKGHGLFGQTEEGCP